MKLRSSSLYASPVEDTRLSPHSSRRSRERTPPSSKSTSSLRVSRRDSSPIPSSSSSVHTDGDEPETPSKKENGKAKSILSSSSNPRTWILPRSAKPEEPSTAETPSRRFKQLITYSNRKRSERHEKLQPSDLKKNVNLTTSFPRRSTRQHGSTFDCPKSTANGSSKLDFSLTDNDTASDDEILLIGSQEKVFENPRNPTRLGNSTYKSGYRISSVDSNFMTLKTEPSSPSSENPMLEDVEMQDPVLEDDDQTDELLTGASSLTDFTEAEHGNEYATDDTLSEQYSTFTEDEEPLTDMEEVMEVSSAGEDIEQEDLLPQVIPLHLRSAFLTQKLAVLSSLQRPPYPDCGIEERMRSKGVLANLLMGSIERGEGNSCLVLGPKGCGKSRVIEEILTELPRRPIIVRLNGSIHQNDRLAMKAIIHQVSLLIGSNWGKDFVDEEDEADNEHEHRDLSTLPPAAHLPSLVTSLPNLPRATIIILDHFDLFTSHSRQALLYCLLDTVQSLRTGETNAGLAVVGVTSRLDTLTLLEKRVKSRFSHRIVQFTHPPTLDSYISIARKALSSSSEDLPDEWTRYWTLCVEQYFARREVMRWFKDTYAVVRDVTLLCRSLAAVVLDLDYESPWLRQPPQHRSKSHLSFKGLSYPMLCLLVASFRLQDNGFELITFAMLDDLFQRQVKASQVAPVTVDGASIGMLKCTPEILLTAFELMVNRGYFTLSSPNSHTIHKRWVKYRLAFDREDVKEAVEDSGQTAVNRWLKQVQAR